MDKTDYIELKVLIERQAVTLETLLREVQDVKNGLIPNGSSRMEEVEKKITSLMDNRNVVLGAAAVIMFAIIPFVDLAVRHIGDKLING